MSRTFAIGDVHGCSKTFRKLLTEEIRITTSDEIYCIGDYIDRGHDSKGVVDFILELRKQHYRIHTLRGNHEEMLLHSIGNKKNFKLWRQNGGGETIRSFGINSVEELEPVYLDFFKNTEHFFETDECIFVHAGLNFSIPDPLKDKDAMLWIRDYDVDINKMKGKILIHGHTPIPLHIIVYQKFESPYDIDGGCVYKHVEDMGNLVALDINERKIISVKNIE